MAYRDGLAMVIIIMEARDMANELVKINLGCGQKYEDGWINCDVVQSVKADKYFDFESFPYPLEDGSASYILMDNVLEHLSDIPATMTELYRILAPGGIVDIRVPYGKSDWALQDPTHKHYFTERSMDYFTEGHDYNFYADVTFKLRKAELVADSVSMRHKMRNLIPFRHVLKYFLCNLYDGIHFELEKPQA